MVILNCVKCKISCVKCRFKCLHIVIPHHLCSSFFTLALISLNPFKHSIHKTRVGLSAQYIQPPANISTAWHWNSTPDFLKRMITKCWRLNTFYRDSRWVSLLCGKTAAYFLRWFTATCQASTCTEGRQLSSSLFSNTQGDIGENKL